MELIFSNIPPVRLPNRSMYSAFEDMIHDADSLCIASGYISTEALTELKRIFEMNKKSYLELIIGMHWFDGFTRSQYEAAKYLDDYLRSENAGEIKVATVFRFHGKVYSFLKKNSPFAGIIGSSNLNSVFDNQNTYETDILLREPKIVSDLHNFISALSEKACTPFNKLKIKKFIESKNILLEGHEGVEKATKEELSKVRLNLSGVSFKIPIKSADAPHSNLNVYFGRGRENNRGLVKPRHWYEVELIVPIDITSKSSYPKAGYPKTESIITVYTDDGWKFDCKISGQNSKNFRSADDLKILGRWIKGRLENNGALKVGEPVTRKVLEKYGRDNFELIGTKESSVWLLNFGV